MTTRYPGTGIDDGTTLPNPATTDTVAAVSHAAQHANANDAIKAVETKIGTGSSTPVVSTLLFGTGTGTSAWTALTSAQLLATISDETGTGSLVFATTPTLVTPKIDTINEATGSNGTTIGGVNIKSGALNTNNSVVTSNITNAAVTANKLATGAAFATVATSETTASTSYTDLATPGPAVTVTIGANGLALVVISCQLYNVTAGGQPYMGFAVSSASTVAAADTAALSHKDTGINGLVQGSFVKLLTSLTPGSNIFTAKYKTIANTATFLNRDISVVPL